MEDIIDLAVAFSCPVLPAGKDLGLLIEAGGGAVASSDAATKMGLRIMPFSTGLQDKLADYLKDKVPPSNNRKNPVDLVWAPIGGASKLYADCLEMLLPEVDVCLVITYAFLQEEWFRQKLVELRDGLGKPIVLIAANPPDQMDGMISAVKDGLPTYVMPDNAIRCIGAMLKRAEYLSNMKL
jgi:acyl-CoA synthetase (NDP forming)